MVGEKWIQVAGVAVLLTLAGSGLWVAASELSSDQRPNPSFAPVQASLSSAPSRAEQSAMEAQAADACRCARRLPNEGPDRDACWTAFNRSVARYQHSEAASMCIPLSPELVCFGDDMTNCIVKNHGGGACSAEEARTLEAIWGHYERDSQESMDLASRKMDEAVQAFIRGERVRAPHGATGGCSD